MQFFRSLLGVVVGLIIVGLTNLVSRVLAVVAVATFASDAGAARDIESGVALISLFVGFAIAYWAYKKIARVRKANPERE